jgi:RimJ/RimL family protein N-acetyltransferase
MDPVELVGEAVVLRTAVPADAENLTEAIQHEDIPRWIDVIPWPYTLDDAHFFIGEIVRPGWESGENPIWLITDRSSQQVLGTVGLTARLPGVFEVGYWLTPSARGRGLMTESVGLVCDFGFGPLGADRIEWQAVVGNVASRQVADRLGFTFEGTARGRLRKGGASADAWIASLLPQDSRTRERDRLLPWVPVPLASEHIALRAAEPGDAEWVAEAYADPDVTQWNPAEVSDLESAAQWIRSRGDWTGGDHASWLICDRVNGRRLGSVSLHKVNEENLSASIGYWTHPAQRGRGAASRAVQLVSAWALEQLGLKRVELIHAVANHASCKVAERSGFALEGTVRNGERYGDGQWYDEHIHGRVPRE